MKNLILLLAVFSLHSCISVRVDKTDEVNKVFSHVKNPNVSATVTFLDFEIKDDNWSNQNSFNSTQAKFKNSVGNSSIKLKVTKHTRIDFHHQLRVKGNIKFEIIQPNDEVIYTKEFSSNKEENFSLDLKRGEYIVKWTAQNADGSYYLEWKEQ